LAQTGWAADVLYPGIAASDTTNNAAIYGKAPAAFTGAGTKIGGGVIRTSGDVIASGNIYSVRAAPTNIGFGTMVSGEGQDRFRIQCSGLMEWGDGSLAPDVTLSRNSKGSLQVKAASGASQFVLADSTGVNSTRMYANSSNGYVGTVTSKPFKIQSGSVDAIAIGTTQQSTFYGADTTAPIAGQVTIGGGVIRAGAKIGIALPGGAAPARALDVYGSGQFKDASGVDATIWSNFAPGTGGVGTNSNGGFAIVTKGSPAIEISTSQVSTFKGTIAPTSAGANQVAIGGGVTLAAGAGTATIKLINTAKSQSSTIGHDVYGWFARVSSNNDTHEFRNAAGARTFYVNHNTGTAVVMGADATSTGQVSIGGGTVRADGNGIFKGAVYATAVIVKASSAFPDYVFAPDYKLRSLEEVEVAIKRDRHLPNIPSAAEIAKNGLPVSDMIVKQMEKIEELTLYSIGLHKQNLDFQQKNQSLEQRLALIEEKLTKIANGR